MQDEIKYMPDHGLGEWLSPVTLVPKLDGPFRFYVDYRKVNSLTKSDSYPLPRVDACIDALGRARFITCYDRQVMTLNIIIGVLRAVFICM